MTRTILIIKLGYSETLVDEKGFVPSLGDVFRHTVLLHHYADERVTWLTSDSALPLLTDNPFIDELLTYSEETRAMLLDREFDEVVCLEKAETICELAHSVRARKYLGFGWCNKGTHAYSGSESTLDIVNGKDQFLPIQALLYQMVGDYWSGQDYVLGYKPKTKPVHDVGLNHMVGSKWPSKAWPGGNWQELEKLCRAHGLSVSWQRGSTDLREYMDWINSCRLVVTCDSLGMHLGLALKKKVVSLFGPTASDQIYTYGRGVVLTADWACPDAPCMLSECNDDSICMKEIRPQVVARTVNNLLNGKSWRERSRRVAPTKHLEEEYDHVIAGIRHGIAAIV